LPTHSPASNWSRGTGDRSTTPTHVVIITWLILDDQQRVDLLIVTWPAERR
jgi:hypothetical protein